MAITSELLGKLGGADVEVTPVEGPDSDERRGVFVLHTVEVPAGETWMVAMHGHLSVSITGSFSPRLIIGTTISPPRGEGVSKGLAHIGTGTIEIKIQRNGNGTDTFTGHVYTFKL